MGRMRKHDNNGIDLFMFFLIGIEAVVVSIDPRRVYLKDPMDVKFKSIKVTTQVQMEKNTHGINAQYVSIAFHISVKISCINQYLGHFCQNSITHCNVLR